MTQLNIIDLPSPILDYLVELQFEERLRYTERQLRRIRTLPTEAEQLDAFEKLREEVEHQD